MHCTLGGQQEPLLLLAGGMDLLLPMLLVMGMPVVGFPYPVCCAWLLLLWPLLCLLQVPLTAACMRQRCVIHSRMSRSELMHHQLETSCLRQPDTAASGWVLS